MLSLSTDQLIQILLDLESAGAGGEALLCRPKTLRAVGPQGSVAPSGAVPERPFLLVRQEPCYGARPWDGREAGHAAPARLACLDGLDGARLLAIGQDEGLSFCCFRAYYFAEPPCLPDQPPVVQQAGAFVALAAGEEVARAWSARCNARAGEVLVETCRAWRRRGYGRAVCAAWARAQFAEGRVAFYNHPARNLASQALAHSLRLEHLIDGAWCYEAPGALG